MHLEKDEKILKIYYHSLFPFLVTVMELLVVTLPFFFILYLLKDSISFNTAVVAYSLILFIFALLLVYLTLIYWLDRLVITNKRVIFIDWKYLTVKVEAETELKDIQDIVSRENGFLSLLPLLDFGTVEIKSASNKTAIDFTQAPNPNGIKKFIQTLAIKKHEHDRGINHSDTEGGA